MGRRHGDTHEGRGPARARSARTYARRDVRRSAETYAQRSAETYAQTYAQKYVRKSARRFARSGTAVVATAVLALGAVGAGTAAAAPPASLAARASLTLHYTCEVKGFNRPLTARIDARLPARAAVGEPVRRSVVRVSTSASPDEASLLRRFGVRSVKGSVGTRIGVTTRHGTRRLPVSLVAPRTTVPDSGGFTVTAKGTGPSPVFDRPGRVRVSAGDIVLHATGTGADGRTVGRLDVPCALDGGQHAVIGSFEVTRGGAGGGPGQGPDAGSGSGTGSGSSGIPDETPHGGHRDALAATGRPTGALAALAFLAAGTVTAGAAVLRSAHRRERG